jgi:hypothetical protein
MIKNSHVVAAFAGVVLVAWLQWTDPSFPNPGRLTTVWQAALFFGLLWECMLRLPPLFDRLLRRQGTKQGRIN